MKNQEALRRNYTSALEAESTGRAEEIRWAAFIDDSSGKIRGKRTNNPAPRSGR